MVIFKGVSLYSVYYFMFMSESSSTCAQYVALAKENWMKERHNMPSLAQENGFGPAFSTGFRGWYMAQQNGFGPAFATGCKGWHSKA